MQLSSRLGNIEDSIGLVSIPFGLTAHRKTRSREVDELYFSGSITSTVGELATAFGGFVPYELGRIECYISTLYNGLGFTAHRQTWS
jgi:hypothetical protein